MGKKPIDISELPPPAAKHDISYYFVLIFFVGPIWSIVPAAWAFTVYAIFRPSKALTTTSSYVCLALALAEVAFSLYHYTLQQRVSQPSPLEPIDLIELQQAFKRVIQSGLAALPEDGLDEESLGVDRPGSPAYVIEHLAHDDERAIDYRNRLRTWFRKVPWSQVHLHQVKQWLYWSSFNAALPSPDKIPSVHSRALEEAVELLEKRVGRTFPKGSNPNVKPLLLTIDPVNVLPRPLIWYLFVKGANLYLRSRYEAKYGLRYGKFGELEYLIRIPDGYNRETDKNPVIFLHGLGLGVFQYQRMLSHVLDELSDVPLLVPLQPQISQDIFHPRFLRPMLRKEKVGELAGLLDGLGWAGPSVKTDRGITVLSHSNGSFSHAWILKSIPEYVTRSCFVDPVTFCSWEGDVCYNFLYSKCNTGMELIIRYFVGTELGVANLLQRHFDWLSNTLWFEEIPNARDPQRSLFLLGGKDSILDAHRVKRYLTSHGVKEGLWLDPNGRHGQALLAGENGINRVLNWIRNDPNEIKLQN